MRRSGPLKRVVFCVLTLCFLLTATLWVYSFFRSIDYSYPCAMPAPATTRFAGWKGGGYVRVNHLQPGAVLLNVPFYMSSPQTSPRWQVSPAISLSIRMVGVSSFMTPTLFGPFGVAVIPLWLPFVIFGIPCAILWRQEIQRWRLLSGERGAKIIRERFGRKMTRLVSMATGILALTITPFMLDLFEEAFPVLQIRKLKGELERYSETLYLSLLLFTWLLTSYFVARLLLRWLRWKTCYEQVPVCNRCGYNLTGNTSGICPECGSPRSKITGPKS